jgi:penicillin-binding protein 1A
MNIPTLIGLSPHPTQVAEAQRLAELKRTDPLLAAARSGENRRPGGIMSDQTRDQLKKIAGALRKAAGMPAETIDPSKPAQPGQPERRAETLPAVPAGRPATELRTR